MSKKARIERERFGVRTGGKPAAERDLLDPFGGGLRDTSARPAASRAPGAFELFPKAPGKPRFFFDHTAAGRRRISALVDECFPVWKARALHEAEKICRHRLTLLGYGDFDLGASIDWNRDPLTGRSWGSHFWADYAPVADPFAGDPKLILELGRHQHLPKLGKAYFLTGEERFAGEAIRQMQGGIDQNPPWIGIHWHSSLDIGLRAVNWIWTLFFLSGSQSLDAGAARRILQSLHAQLDHVYRHPSIYSSPNTHLIGEAVSLFIARILLRGWKNAVPWRRFWSSFLLREIEGLVSSEGIHTELSSYYHCYALDMFMQALVLARNNGFKVPRYAWCRLSDMLDFLLHVTRPDGSLPSLGDDH